MKSIYALLVDDDAVFAHACKKMLVHGGYKLDWAEDAERAHHHILLHPRRYHVILLDLNMPKTKGRDLVKSLRAAHITTPIIVVTANARKASRESLLKKGVSAYVVKPFTYDVLHAAMRAAVLVPKQSS
jgi:DNA-binding response OmpR family regulator